MSTDEIFDDEFMNDMMMNPDLYRMDDGLEQNESFDEDDEEEDD